MKITRDTTGETINRIWNDPAVKPHLYIDGARYFDLSRMAPDPRCYALIGEPPLGAYLAWTSLVPGGGIIEGWYEFHVGVLPDGRGKWTVEFSQAALNYMFDHTPATHLLTRIPQGALGSLTLARRFGLTLLHPHYGECQHRGRMVPYSLWHLAKKGQPDGDWGGPRPADWRRA